MCVYVLVFDVENNRVHNKLIVQLIWLLEKIWTLGFDRNLEIEYAINGAKKKTLDSQ